MPVGEFQRIKTHLAVLVGFPQTPALAYRSPEKWRLWWPIFVRRDCRQCLADLTIAGIVANIGDSGKETQEHEKTIKITAVERAARPYLRVSAQQLVR